MSFPVFLHELIPSVRFGRVLFAEVAPPPPATEKCRYCRSLLPAGSSPPLRAHFSDPAAAVRAVLAPLEHGASVDTVVLGGPGEPLRHRGIGAILRRIRSQAHLGAVVLTNGAPLRDRDVRREAAEAGLVVVWMPALEDGTAEEDAYDRAQAFERHVEAVASLRRETPAAIALEFPVRPGLNDGPASRDAWRAAVDRIRPERVFLMPAPNVEEAQVGAVLEDLRRSYPRSSGVFLDDGTIVDRRCFCGVEDAGAPAPRAGDTARGAMA
jgi:wyosine [tRNA(Phe)-imidazoG37] synthetase (radical SAM superfamily)